MKWRTMLQSGATTYTVQAKMPAFWSHQCFTDSLIQHNGNWEKKTQSVYTAKWLWIKIMILYWWPMLDDRLDAESSCCQGSFLVKTTMIFLGFCSLHCWHQSCWTTEDLWPPQYHRQMSWKDGTQPEGENASEATLRSYPTISLGKQILIF